MFNIIQDTGFGITFDNGYRIVVQWGPDNECFNANEFDRFNTTLAIRRRYGRDGSRTAEVKIYDDTGILVRKEPHCGPERVAYLIDLTLSSIPGESEPESSEWNPEPETVSGMSQYWRKPCPVCKAQPDEPCLDDIGQGNPMEATIHGPRMGYYEQ